MRQVPIARECREPVNSPFTGVCTFFKTHLGRFLEFDNPKPDLALVGVPYDMGTTARSGARFGPRAVREASTIFCDGLEGVYDPERDETFMDGGQVIVDYGDVDVIHADCEKTFENVEYAVGKIVEIGAKPVIVGGDHSITIPVARAMKPHHDICLVQLDAHLDWSDSPGGQRHGHGSPVRRISEMNHFSEIIQIGLRGLGSSKPKDFSEARAWGSNILTVRDYRRGGIDELKNLLPVKNIFVTIDMDVFDPSIAPGTGSPQAGGLLYDEVDLILETISRKGRVIGFDLVEVCPPYDPSGITSHYAAQTIFNFCSYILKYL